MGIKGNSGRKRHWGSRGPGTGAGEWWLASLEVYYWGMVWHSWPIVAALLAIAAAMMANPAGLLRGTQDLADGLQRFGESLRGPGWLASRAEARELTPRAVRHIRVAGACLAAVTILLFLGSA
jgi:hypothetical protein